MPKILCPLHRHCDGKACVECDRREVNLKAYCYIHKRIMYADAESCSDFKPSLRFNVCFPSSCGACTWFGSKRSLEFPITFTKPVTLVVEVVGVDMMIKRIMRPEDDY